MEQHTLVLKKTLHNHQTCYSPIARRQSLSRFFLSTPTGRSLC